MGLDDRDYMRAESRRWNWGLRWSGTAVLAAVLVGIFLLQLVFQRYAAWVDDWFALSLDGLRHGRVWQLLTFQFLHAGLLHLAGNVVGLWFFGRYVEERVGLARFLKIYFTCGVVGGLLEMLLGLLVPGSFGGPLIGASAGVVGLFAILALLEPDASVLLWFVIPMRARHVFWIFFWITAALTLAKPFLPFATMVSHAAHLGGMLTAMAILRWQIYGGMAEFGWSSRQTVQPYRELVGTMTRSLRRRTNAPDPAPDLPPEEFISREVDPILDKISAHGIHSLTAHEREILDAARKKMTRR